MPLSTLDIRDLLPWRFISRHPRLALSSNVISTGCLFWIIGSLGVRRARFSIFRRYTLPETPGAEVAFQAADGVRLAATYWKGPHDRSPGLLVVHGMGACRRSVAANAAWFAARGYAVLAVDLRGHGGSAAAHHSFGWTESMDVHAAFHWLKRRQHDARIGVLGISMGGAAALIGRSGPVPADAMVLQAVFTTMRETLRCRMALVVGGLVASAVEPFLSFQSRLRFGVWPNAIAPLSAMAGVRCPVMVIGGSSDGYVPQAQTRALHAAASHVTRVLWIADDSLGHKDIADTEASQYRDRVLTFLDQTLLER